MARRLTFHVVVVVGLAVAAGSLPGHAQDDERRVTTRLRPTQEVPAISSLARGAFRAAIDEGDGVVTYELVYLGLEADITQAHIHTAQPGVNGGIMVWLCGTTGQLAGPAGTPPCPGPREGTVTGEITPASVIGPESQGVSPGEFAAFVRAIRNGVAYANVHSQSFPGGEIRGQITDDDGDDDNN